MDRCVKRISLAIFILAFLARLGYVWFLKQQYMFYGFPSSDVSYYQVWAREIALGQWVGKEVFWGLPLYPYVLAVLYRLCLGNWEAVRVIHLLLGSLNCVLLYSVGRRIFTARVALLAALLTAFNFVLIYYDWLMMPVTLIIFLSLLLIFIFLDQEQLQRKRHWFLLGTLAGLTALGDGKILIFVALLAVFSILNRRQRTVNFKNVLIMLCGVAVIIGGVTVRNRIVGGSWVMISAQNGLSFYVGNNPNATGIFENPGFIRPTHFGQDEDQQFVAEMMTKRKLNAQEVSRYWKNKAWEFIKGHPWDYAKLLGRKVAAFMQDNESSYDIDLLLQRQWKNRLDFNPFFLIFPLAIAGFWLSRKDSAHHIYLWLLAASQLCVTLLFFLTFRHRASLLPVLILYESFCLVWLFDQLRHRLFLKPLGLLAVIGVYLFFLSPQALDAKIIDFIYYSKAGLVFDQRGDHRKARELYNSALELNPYDTNTYYNLGNTYFFEGEYQSAEQYYLTVVRTCRHHVDARFNLAATYEKMGEPQKALGLYEEVLGFQPDDIPSLYRIAMIYQSQGRCADAKKYYEKIVKINGRYAEEVSTLVNECR